MKYYAAIIVSMIIWGSVGVFTRYANQPSHVIVFFRVLCASLSLLPFVVKGKESGRSRAGENYKMLVLSGIFLSLNWLFFFKAVQTTTIAKATLSYYTAPVIVTILSPILLKERLEGRTILSVAMAFAGVIMIVLFPLTGSKTGSNAGIVFGLLAAFFYSLVTITAKYLSNTGPVRLAFYQTLVSVIIFAPFMIGREMPGLDSIFVMILIGVLHTSITLTLYFYGIGGVKVQHAGVLSYMDPLSAVIFGILAFGEVPSPATAAGGALILLSSLTILRRKR